MPGIASPYLTQPVAESAVGLIVTEAGDRRNAMTVSFFSEVSHHPASLWVAIAKNSYTCELVEQAQRFSLIVLHEHQQNLARLCGTLSGRQHDKCAQLSLYRSSDEFLFLEGALASVACQVRTTIDAGDHAVYIAHIVAGDTDTRTSTRRHLLTVDLL